MKRLTAVAVAAFLMLGAANAKADLIEISATSLSTQIGDFSLIFDDANGDGLLELSELISFSGTTVLGDYLAVLIQVPDYAGLSIFSAANDLYTVLPSVWAFCATAQCDTRWGVFSNAYTYTTTRITSVTEPGTLALFGLGLLGIGLMRRRRAAERSA